MSANRNTQLDGWRAFAVLGVMWLHWAPAVWRGPWPFEIGLFYFLTLTGFLITRVLLRERKAAESLGSKWRMRAYLHFQKRRMTRILVPCYVAMLFAIIVGASDIRHHFPAYFGHWSNFHMAYMDGWPSGTAHYWTLAIQMQFYLIWPLLIFVVPKRFLPWAFAACVAIAPLSRMILSQHFPEIYHSEAITTSALDYFGVGALLAFTMDRGMVAGDRRLKIAALVACCGYVILYARNKLGLPSGAFGYIQQTLVAIVFAGLMSSTMAGFDGIRGKILDHPVVQHIGKLSFGLYLFHTPVPLLLGWVIPHLWGPFFTGYWQMIRLGVFGLTAWGLAYLCWRYLETKPVIHHKHAPSGSPDR